VRGVGRVGHSPSYLYGNPKGADQVMPFVFRRHGYLVIVFYFGALVLMQVLVDSIFGTGFYAFNAWPKYVAVALGSLLCWTVGKWLNSGAGKRLVDTETGKEVVLPAPSHDFLFIKVEYWGVIGAIACIVSTALWELGIIQP
jgi:hypothetical protein